MEYNEEKLPEETAAPEAAVTEETEKKELFTMPEGSVEEEEIVDRDFWKGLTLPEVYEKPRRHGTAKRVVLNIVMAAAFISVGFGIACVTARGRGVVSNLVTGGKHMTFDLKVDDRPETDDERRDEDGRYTAEGIAAVCGPSVVSLDIFTEQSELVPTGKGSGIIVSTDGYIVSNAHVVDKATNGIKVVLNDEREYAATVIGSDPRTDIAVIKIPAVDLQPAEFGNSDQVRLGEEVVCIGTPAGYRHSISKGVVSGIDRKVLPESSAMAVNCLQVDAAINPGNSGGAMFNMWGQVIGITSSKLASIDYEGIGFAITTNEAKTVIEDLMEYGFVQGKARMGITYIPISQATAEITGSRAGMNVQSIASDCDAANSGLMAGDLITEIDGVKVEDIEDVTAFVQSYEPGDEITVHVFRKVGDSEEEMDFTFKLMNDRGTLVETDKDE